MLAVLIIAALTSFTLKNTFTRERPFVVYPDIEKLSEAGSSSFPSGHTLETFAIATALSLLIPKKKVIIPVFCWAILVAYSRMTLGVHYPSDVLGGIMIGMIIGWLVPAIMGRFWKEKPETGKV
jgi:membrane-associated phospholipid phosphatase